MVKKYVFSFPLLFLLVQWGYCQNFGSSNHPMNKLTKNIDVLNFWEKQSPLINNLFVTAEEVLRESKDADYSNVIRDTRYKELVAQYDIKLLGGPMLGDIKSDGVSVWVRTAMPASVKILVKNASFQKVVGPLLTFPEKDLTAVFQIKGLKPSTKYFYYVELDGKVMNPLKNKYFTTAPQEEDGSPVRIAFGSCPHRWGMGNHELWEQISQRDPHAMLLLGDIAVQDRNDHLGMHRADYLRRDLQLPWSKFVSEVPVYASWDDHDYFDNDEAGIPKGYDNRDKEGVWKVFKDSWNNPSYGMGEKGKGIFTRTRIGQVDVIMTDNRYFRTGEKGSFLGDDQMNWLKEELLKCKGPFIILSCGSMWSDYVSNGKDSWGVNDPEGREELLTFIEDNNIGGVIFISGDRHGARGFTIPRESGLNFYEFEAASLGGREGPPAKKESWDTQLYGYDAVFAFGELTIHPEGNNPYIVYRLIRKDGEILFEEKIFRSQLIPANY